MTFSTVFNQVNTILLLFCKKGDKQQNISFSGEGRRFGRCGIPYILVILVDGFGISLQIIDDHQVNDSLHITVQLKVVVSSSLQMRVCLLLEL